MAKLENLLSFNDYEKNWNIKKQKTTKRTEVGLDVLNEHLYMKVMDQEASGWKENVKKFVASIDKAIEDGQVKDVVSKGDSVTFTIRGRKHKIDKSAGSITLWRVKTTATRKKFTDPEGRVKEERKRTKTSENIEVKVPIGKNEAEDLYEKLVDLED